MASKHETGSEGQIAVTKEELDELNRQVSLLVSFYLSSLRAMRMMPYLNPSIFVYEIEKVAKQRCRFAERGSLQQLGARSLAQA